MDELGRWRSVPPEKVGIPVSGDVDEPVLLSLWMVEASSGKGERRVVVQPIAVKQDGRCVPAVERLREKLLQTPPASPLLRDPSSGTTCSPMPLSRSCSENLSIMEPRMAMAAIRRSCSGTSWSLVGRRDAGRILHRTTRNADLRCSQQGIFLRGVEPLSGWHYRSAVLMLWSVVVSEWS